MSRVHDAGSAAASIAGAVALPLPAGDVEGLRGAARSLDRVAARARSTLTVRGTLGARLGAVWTGDAATAAGAEAAELARRCHPVVDALPAAARALLAYAAALDHAIARVRSLQRQWDALDAEHVLTALRLAALPDPTGTIGVLGMERSRADQAAGRARLSRAYSGVIDELTATARRCAVGISGVTGATFPPGRTVSAATVQSAVTGGLWFADGVVAARASRDAGLADSVLVRRAVSAGGGSAGGLRDDTVAQIATRIGARVDDPVYAQTLLSELGADGLAQLLLAAGVTRGGSGPRVDTVRRVLGAFGSLVITATSHRPPPGTDPRTRAQLASGAALLADDLVAGVDTVRVDPSGSGRATGAWLLGQLLSGARAAGDDRRLPARLTRRAAAAVASAEVAETRDADSEMRHGTTVRPDGAEAFASWFDDAARTGDALHVLLENVGDDPAEQAALLAEPLPGPGVTGGALSNSRGDRLTLGEHLVRRWITHEANGIESHPDLRLATDADLARLLSGVVSGTDAGAAETRARVMLELSRTSAHAMLEASTTRIYARSTAPVENLVVDWFSAMRENVDLALMTPLQASGPAPRYSAETSRGTQPWLDSRELAGVVGALAVDTGMGLHAKDAGAAYDRLVDHELAAAQTTVGGGGDVRRDIVRLGFLDQAASAALVAVARRQDALNRSAWQGLAEAGHAIDEIRRGGPMGLVSMVHTYAQGGTLRTTSDDLVIALVRSDVELSQTELDDARRATLVSRVESLAGGCADVRSTITVGAGRAPLLPTAGDLRAARQVEIRAAVDALLDDKAGGSAGSATERLGQRTGPTDRLHIVRPSHDVQPDACPSGRSSPPEKRRGWRAHTCPRTSGLCADVLMDQQLPTAPGHPGALVPRSTTATWFA